MKLVITCCFLVSEHEYNIFGDNGAEVCLELATMCPAVARTVSLHGYTAVLLHCFII